MNNELNKIKVEVVEQNKPQVLDEKQLDKHVQPKEINGPKGLEPTRYGDWEAKGRCFDF